MIKLYWHRGSGRSDATRQNFGDYLSPLIVEAVSGERVEYAPLSEADMMAIGTILANERKAKRFLWKRRLHVWGSGCGQPDERFSNRHHYHAVRGVETLNRIQGEISPPALGDPGLLSPMLLSRLPSKKHKLGFVPHYVDQRLPSALKFREQFAAVHFIDVFSPPLQVIKEIAESDFVISSSLHGLVVADAFAVPNVRVRLSSGLLDELKFDDYYSAFNLQSPEVLGEAELFAIFSLLDGLSQQYSRPGLDKIQANLVKRFPKF